ncbi:RnfABCDGE type electron transport complex subunit B [Candidatus Stoquefichus sp. SB1]|jgi:electron transport complex protein RnfB|uniref:RnfABCDGE type electron transport complex subunit B n=1 Tax=Candidatus Stoquefichus sp. SB1 TaxID=1658109 RepID=UPI00067E7A2D|nr:RnfABCDGE type electron transport complex subunit B [Candidatus Stoquefichus sp. SB1]
MNISAVLSLVAIGAVLGAILGIANKYLIVEEDNRIGEVMEMLPGANCGGCGYPGCSGFANALVEGEAKKVSACVVSNQETREKISTYLNETPGPDGQPVKVTI